MKRWRYFNPNPVARDVGDCSVRAVAAALDVDWETAYALIAEAGFDMGNVISANEVFGAVLRRHGFYKMELPKDCPDCYTAEDFAWENPNGTFVAVFDGHVACIRDGEILDSWDSSSEPIKYVWYRKDGR